MLEHTVSEGPNRIQRWRAALWKPAILLPSHPGARLLLTLLLAADLLFVVLHILYLLSPYIGLFGEPVYSLEKDRSFSEAFQYVQEYWVVLLFALLAYRRASPAYLGWSLVFSYLLIDDVILVHERLGAAVARALDYQPMIGLRAQDLGELTVMAGIGLVVIVTLGAAYLLGGRDFRQASHRVLGLLMLLIAAGIGVDMLHMMVGNTTPLGTVLGMVEDGGELVVMSLICAYVAGLVLETGLKD